MVRHTRRQNQLKRLGLQIKSIKWLFQVFCQFYGSTLHIKNNVVSTLAQYQICEPQYRSDLAMQKPDTLNTISPCSKVWELHRQGIDNMIKMKVFESPQRNWTTLKVIAHRMKGTIRFNVNCCNSNVVTLLVSYLIAQIDMYIELLRACTVLSVLDAITIYWQVHLSTTENRYRTHLHHIMEYSH